MAGLQSVAPYLFVWLSGICISDVRKRQQGHRSTEQVLFVLQSAKLLSTSACSPQIPLIKAKSCFTAGVLQERAAVTCKYCINYWVFWMFIHRAGNTNNTEKIQSLFLETSPIIAQIINFPKDMMSQIFSCTITTSTVAE